MTSPKMSDVFELPVGVDDFVLIAIRKSTCVSMDKAAVIAINSYDANQSRIVELEKELSRLKRYLITPVSEGVALQGQAEAGRGSSK